MSATLLREAFNSVGAAKCQRATLTYDRANDTEWQILTFYGNGPDGPFEIKSDRVRPRGDIYQAARATAHRMIDQGTPKP